MNQHELFDPMQLDVAALRILLVTYAEGSFTAAAALLGISQSSVSYAIKRARQVFDDPLFLRIGRRIVPTRRCVEIAKDASDLLARFDEIARPHPFDPATAEFEVTISMCHMHRIIVLAPLMRLLARESPGVLVRVVDGYRNGHADLRVGSSDICISHQQLPTDTLVRRRLLRDNHVCVVDREHPLAAKGSISLEDYLAARHLLVSYEGWMELPHVGWLAKRQLSIETVVDLNSTSGVETFVQGTDLIATVLSRLAATFSDRVRVLRAPFDVEVDLHMYWTARTHHAGNMRWMRDMIFAAVREERSGPTCQ